MRLKRAPPFSATAVRIHLFFQDLEEAAEEGLALPKMISSNVVSAAAREICFPKYRSCPAGPWKELAAGAACLRWIHRHGRKNM